MSDIYRHYKGGVYNVIGMGRHTETQESLIFYEGAEGNLWARPEEIFMSKVEVNGHEVDRFQHLGQFNK